MDPYFAMELIIVALMSVTFGGLIRLAVQIRGTKR